MSATEASRGFSSLLSRVANGESVEVDRHGHVVAVVSPPRPTSLSGGALLALLGRLRSPDADFAADVRSLADTTMSPRDPWQR